MRAKLNQLVFEISPRTWLAIAAVFHILLAITIFLIGHYKVLPNIFDEHGIGISFAVDGVGYRRVITDMAELLRQREVSAWFAAPTPLHCRLYSLAFLFSGSVVGYNILAAEALNLLYYLGILSFIFCIGTEVFNRQTGLMAAIIVGLWPSFLIHTTQLIRDPFSILLLLAVLFVLTILLRRKLEWRSSLLIAIVSGTLLVVFWLARGNMWNIVLIALAITAILMAVRTLLEHRLLLPNAVVLITLFSTALLVPSRLPSTAMPGTKIPEPVFVISSDSKDSGNWLDRLTNEVKTRRSGFRVYDAQQSNIDSEVKFNNASDIIRYMPRAIVVGCFAPFPPMWLESGTGGRAGRLLAGSETLAMYLFYGPTLFCMWRHRRDLTVWLFFLVAFIGMMSLGLVVVNAGALFRFRYVFWMLVIVLGTEGMRILKKRPA